MFTFIYRKPSDCIISSDQIITSDFVRFVLFSSIQLISSDHLISSITSVHLNFVRPYYFRLSYLPVQFSSSYFALFLYLNTNLIQIKSRTRTFPETATRSLRPRRIYCNTDALLKAKLDSPSVEAAIPVGRPRLSTASSDKSKNLQRENRPSTKRLRLNSDVRFYQFRHFPTAIDALGQPFKMESCHGQSLIKCKKCDVFLCLTKKKLLQSFSY